MLVPRPEQMSAGRRDYAQVGTDRVPADERLTIALHLQPARLTPEP